MDANIKNVLKNTILCLRRIFLIEQASYKLLSRTGLNLGISNPISHSASIVLPIAVLIIAPMWPKEKASG
jgi:hypothetical protein